VPYRPGDVRWAGDEFHGMPRRTAFVTTDRAFHEAMLAGGLASFSCDLDRVAMSQK